MLLLVLGALVHSAAAFVQPATPLTLVSSTGAGARRIIQRQQQGQQGQRAAPLQLQPLWSSLGEEPQPATEGTCMVDRSIRQVDIDCFYSTADTHTHPTPHPFIPSSIHAAATTPSPEEEREAAARRLREELEKEKEQERTRAMKSYEEVGPSVRQCSSSIHQGFDVP